MTLSFKKIISHFIDDISLSFGFSEIKKATHTYKKPHSSKNEKYMVLSFFNSDISQGVLSVFDLDIVGKFSSGFSWLFKSLKLHSSEDFSSLLEHAKLVDTLLTVADSKDSSDEDIQQSIRTIENFFLNNFGGVKFDKKMEEDILKCRKISLPKDKEMLDDYLWLLILSIFSHLDAVIHNLAFPDIEPICLGWLFMKKLDPSYTDNNSKSKWTNPSRSLIKLMTAFSLLSNSEEPKMPEKLYGEELLDILKKNESDPDDKRGNLVKKANEGTRLSFCDLFWILYDQRIELELCIDEQSRAEMLSIIMGTDQIAENKSNLNSPQLLLGTWIVYYFFHYLYDLQNKRDKNQAEYHGYYYDYWLMFNRYYVKNQGKHHPFKFKWPEELVELAH